MTATAVDLMISFDTTSSMHAVLEAARRSLGPVVLRSLLADNANLRVGLILHGDYGDLYETRIAQPTDSLDALVAFLADAPGTCGLDYPECYELVLHQAATKVRWRGQGASRLLVMLGDAVPHEPTSKRNKYGLDWRKEARALADTGVAVYCVDCGGVGTGFYGFARQLSDICGGATVPYRGCGELRRLIKRLLRQPRETSRQALDWQYRRYHSDSQRAQTAPARLPPAIGNEEEVVAGPRAATAAPQAAKLRHSEVALALVRGGGLAIGKTANWARRLLMYIGLAYLVYTLCTAACLA